MEQLHPGDTLYLRAGEYIEFVDRPDIRAGELDARITVAAQPGERAVIVGGFWVDDARYWTFDGINVTWDPANSDAEQHMVRLSGGEHWSFTNAEIWGARSYAALLVTGGARNWSVTRSFIHDTHPANALNQDQLIYVSDARDGTIEHCLLVGSANGRGVKLGRPSPDESGPEDITVRYNTFVGNHGGAISSSYAARANHLYGNVMVGVGSGASINAYRLDPESRTLAYDNIGWNVATVVSNDSGLVADGNRVLDPGLDGTFRPTNPALLDDAGRPTVGHLRSVAPTELPTWQLDLVYQSTRRGSHCSTCDPRTARTTPSITARFDMQR
jgi:hypothetical protein